MRAGLYNDKFIFHKKIINFISIRTFFNLNEQNKIRIINYI